MNTWIRRLVAALGALALVGGGVSAPAASGPDDLVVAYGTLHESPVFAVALLSEVEPPHDFWFVGAYVGGPDDPFVGDEVRLLLLNRPRATQQDNAPPWRLVADVRRPADALSLTLFPGQWTSMSIVELNTELDDLGDVSLRFEGFGSSLTTWICRQYGFVGELNGGEVWGVGERVEGYIGDVEVRYSQSCSGWGYNMSGYFFHGPV